MADKIRIQMMGSFAVYINEIKVDQLVDKSRKGVALMQILILSRGESVPNHRLMSSLWSEEKSSNPENALKTLVSRMRALLNQVVPDLGRCIVAERGAYSWQCMPGMTVDVYEIEDIFNRLESNDDNDLIRHDLCERLLNLYGGDLLGVRGDGRLLERTVDGGADVGLAQRGPLGTRYAHGHGAGVSGFYQHGNGLPYVLCVIRGC